MALNLHVERWGDGASAVLMLHGFTGSADSWEHLRPSLSPTIRAIAVDLPGHGRSPPPSKEAEAGFAETVDALAAVADRERGPLSLLGYSQGARLAMALALRLPGRFERIVLESGNPGLEHESDRAARSADDAALVRRMETEGVPAFVAHWETLSLFEGIRRLPPSQQAALRARRLTQSASGLAAALRALSISAQPDFWPALSTIRVPTLLVCGREDTKYVDIARRMTTLLPDATLAVLEGCWHAPHLEQPERYAALVRGFLERRVPLEARE